MRRVLPPSKFAKWLRALMPQVPNHSSETDWLQTTVSPDPSDPKLAHLDGLNLGRTWMLEGILSGLPLGGRPSGPALWPPPWKRIVTPDSRP